MPRYHVNLEPALRFRLTPREREILPLIAEGLSTQVVALSLGISEDTVRSHILSLVRKLGASNRTELPLKAFQLGILEHTFP
jgi:DNA-binding NarL/FixJ family response regulator